MNKNIVNIIQLESIPYLIKGKSKDIKYYCCKGECRKSAYNSIANKKLFLYFSVNSFYWSQSQKPLTGYKVIEKIKDLTYFLNQIKHSNPNTQFVINGKEI